MEPLTPLSNAIATANVCCNAANDCACMEDNSPPPVPIGYQIKNYTGVSYWTLRAGGLTLLPIDEVTQPDFNGRFNILSGVTDWHSEQPSFRLKLQPLSGFWWGIANPPGNFCDLSSVFDGLNYFKEIIIYSFTNLGGGVPGNTEFCRLRKLVTPTQGTSKYFYEGIYAIDISPLSIATPTSVALELEPIY